MLVGMKRVVSVLEAAVVATALLVSSALGQSVPPNYAAVPPAFRATLRADLTREQFVIGEMNAFRASARGRPELDIAGVALVVASEKAVRSASAMAQLLAYDLNADGSVSREEVLEALRLRSAGTNTDRQLLEIMRHDDDLNDTLDPQEIRAAGAEAAERSAAASSPAERLLTLAGPDGILRAAELYRAAERAFDIVDLDGDTILSRSEWSAFREAVGPFTPGRRASAPQAKQNAAPMREEDEEVHLVGVYEGFDPVSDRTRGDRAIVAVDRPGRRVTLLLCSHEPVRWTVTLSPGTELRELRAFGHAKASEFVIDDVRRRPERLAGELGCPYKPVGDTFRALVASLRGSTGFSRLSSFGGSYRALKSGFVAGLVSAAPELGPNYLVPAPPNDAGSDYRFSAELRGVRGLYDLRGKLLGEGASGDGIKSVDVPGKREGYRIAEQGLVRVLPVERLETKIPLPQNVPPFSHPSGIAYDTKRERVIVVSYGGEGILYEYDVRNSTWRVVSGMKDRDVKGLIYDGATDRLWGIDGPFTPSALVAIGPDGAIVRSVRLNPRMMPGLSDLYDPGNNSPNLRLASIDEKHAVLIAVGRHAQYRIYLVDLLSGATSLTAFADD